MKSSDLLNVPVIVDDEINHVQFISNKAFRLYKATLLPGQPTKYHWHIKDTIYLVAQGGKIKSRLHKMNLNSSHKLLGGYNIKFLIKALFAKIFGGYSYLPTGFCFMNCIDSKPLIHMAQSSKNNKKRMELIGVELKYTYSSYEIKRFVVEEDITLNMSEYCIVLCTKGRVELEDLNNPTYIKSGDLSCCHKIKRLKIKKIEENAEVVVVSYNI